MFIKVKIIAFLLLENVTILSTHVTMNSLQPSTVLNYVFFVVILIRIMKLPQPVQSVISVQRNLNGKRASLNCSIEGGGFQEPEGPGKTGKDDGATMYIGILP